MAAQGVGTDSCRAQVRAAWSEALSTDDLDEDDNFFALGGDSVCAARLARRLSGLLGVEVKARAVFDHPTLGAFTAHVGGLRAPEPDVPPRADPSTHPLSPGQLRLWLLNRMRPESFSYNVPLIIQLDGPLDRVALDDALTELVRRHEPLRTVFPEHPDGSGGPIGQVLPPAPVEAPTLEPSDASSAHSRANQFLQLPFDLRRQTPVRCAVLPLGGERHWLLVSTHHIATDGDSLRLLLAELGSLYTAAALGTPYPGDPPATSYGDLVAWQRATRAAPDHDRLERRRTALGGLADHPLPLEATPGRAAEGIGERLRCVLSPATTEAIRSLAAGRRTTVFVTLLAMCGELVARWSGHDQHYLGFPISVREPACAHELLGFFLETGLVRLESSGSGDLYSLLDQAHRAVREATVDVVPFELLAEGIAAHRGDRTPPFRVWVNDLGEPLRPPTMHGLTTALVEVTQPPALFDLGIYLVEDDEQITVDLIYEPTVCAPAAAEEFLEQFHGLVRAAVAAPQGPLRGHRPVTSRSAELPDPDDTLAPDGASGAAVEEAETAPGPGSTVRQRISALSRNRPADIAVRVDGRDISGTELAEGVRRLATALREGGIGGDDVVAVFADRGLPLVVSMLAVWSLPAQVLMLDPRHPPARHQEILARARPAMLIRDRPAPELSVPGSVHLDATARVVDVVRATPAPRPPQAIGGQRRPGYVAFTSGTTGRPTGVVGDLGPVEHFLSWYAAAFELRADDRVSLLSGIAHDPLLRDVLLPIWVGGTLCIPTPETYADPERLAQWLRRERVSVVHLTPQLARLIADREVTLEDLRLVCLAGDTVTTADVDRLARLAPSARLVNGYGTTQTPQLVSVRRLAPGSTPQLGAGAPGSQVLVVDADGSRCGIGQPGRLVVRSRHLAGLLPDSDPEDLAALTPDPVPGVMRFVTGDLGRYRTDGSVEHLGRDDDLVKVRGHRVHPLETDRALALDARVSNSITVARDGPDGTELVSFVVGRDVTAPQLRAHLAAVLPAAGVPSSIVLVDQLPLGPTGKVDRRALPVATARPAVTAPVIAAGDPTEARLARVWSTVLGVDRLEVTDSFFDLGGSSLSMIRLQAAVRREFGTTLPLTTLYENPTVRSLARTLSRRPGNEPSLRSRPASSTAQDRRVESARRLAARRSPGLRAGGATDLAGASGLVGESGPRGAGDDRIPFGDGWLLWRPVVLRSAGFAFSDLHTALGEGSWGPAGTDAPDVEAALRAGRRAVLDLARREELRTALQWQNPAVLSLSLDWLLTEPEGPRTSRRRASEHTLVKYVQRYHTKNESVGFYGPVLWVSIEDGAPVFAVRPGTRVSHRMRVYLEDWAVEELAATLCADPAVARFIPPSLAFGVTRLGRKLILPGGEATMLSPVENDVVRLVDGRRLTADLAAALDRPIEQVEAAVRRLGDQGFVDRVLHVPPDLDAELWLGERLSALLPEQLAGEPLRLLAELEAARGRVERAATEAELAAALDDLGEWFTRCTGGRAVRTRAESQVGRRMAVGQAQRDLELRLGAGLVDGLVAPLSLVLQSARWLARSAGERFSELAEREFEDLRVLFGSERVQLNALCQRVLPHVATGQILDEVIEELRRRWGVVLAVDPTAGSVRRTSADLAAAVSEQFDGPPADFAAARHHSPDVMIAAAGADDIVSGRAEFVLGEVHTCMITVDGRSFTDSEPWPGEVRRLADLVLADGEPRFVPLHVRGDSASITGWDHPPPDGHSPAFTYLSFGEGIGERRPPGPVIATADIVVTRDVGGLVATLPDGRTYPLIAVLGEYVGYLTANRFQVLPAAPHSPRVTVDRLVIARETWRIPAAELIPLTAVPEPEAYRGLREIAAAHGIARHTFWRAAPGTKPIYLDLHSPVLGALLVRELRRVARLGEATVTFVEMYPGPNQLWLTDADGRRYTSELRITIADALGRRGTRG